MSCSQNKIEHRQSRWFRVAVMDPRVDRGHIDSDGGRDLNKSLFAQVILFVLSKVIRKPGLTSKCLALCFIQFTGVKQSLVN